MSARATWAGETWPGAAWSRAWVFVFVLALACAAAPSRADVVRSPADLANPLAARQSWVADRGGFFSSAAIAAVDARVFALEDSCGAQIAVATVDTLDTAYEPKQFATELFAAWGVGRGGRDDGVLVLLTREPRRIEVETGYGAEAVLPDGEVGRLLDRHAVPRLREGDYDGAITALVGALAAELERAPAGGEAPPARSRGGLVAAILGGFVTMMGSLFGWLRWKRYRRRCTNCQRLMRFVPGQFEGEFLSSDEALEEQLKSVDHRVFRCDPCDRTLVEPHRRWLSGYSDCPKCRRRTLGYKSHVIIAATRYREGQREVTRRCARPGCGHVAVTLEAIPRIVESSSSGGSSSGRSGSSFGGGRSGGGGAGRSW